MNIPRKLQSVLWSVRTNHLNLDNDRHYIIHQVLSHGGMAELRWIFKNYPKDKLIQTFKKPFRDYGRPRFYFIKDILFGLKNWRPDERFYVKNTS